MHRVALAAVLALALAGCGGGSDSRPPPPVEGDLFVSSVSPSSGTVLGGTRLTIRGGGFSAGVTGIRIGGVPATDVDSSNDTTATCTSPPGRTPGWVDVTVETTIGRATLPEGFRFHNPPFVLGVAPPAGFAFGELTVSIVGVGFERDDAGPPTVLFGDTESLLPQVVNDTLIFATTPPLPPGLVDVTVVNANGADTLRNGFVYLGSGAAAARTSTTPDGFAEAAWELEDGTTTRWWWPDLIEGRAAWTDRPPTSSDPGSRSRR